MEKGASIAAAENLPAVPESPELVPGTPAIKGIAEAVVIKDGNLFFLSERDGNVPLTPGHGFGLYYNDCRFLKGYELTVGGRKAEVLVRNAERDFMATLGLFNPDLRFEGRDLLKHSVEIRWERVASGEQCALFDSITFQNLTSEPIRFPLALRFSSAFEDIFTIRGLYAGKRGTMHPPTWESDDVLSFRYDGADEIERELAIQFSPRPEKMEQAAARFVIELDPLERRQLLISLFVSSSEMQPRGAQRQRPARLKSERCGSQPQSPASRPSRSPSRRKVSALETVNEDQIRWLQGKTRIHTDSLLLNRIIDRSLRDLGMLRNELGEDVSYFAAGVPWFVALFGRDSIITALQTLAYDSRIAGQTIRLLAEYQGKGLNPWREEEPGKILHELRVGEMAHLNEIPHTPYYGTIDATPLWLVLVGKHAAWTGDLGLFKELRPQIEAALTWIEQYGDKDGDGYVEYECTTEKGLANQGWKDSGDGIVNADGSLATPPIALIEVQGYVYEAKREMAALFRRVGETERADQLERDAQELRARVNRDFWISDGYYALALQGADNRRAAVLSSNAGHACWSGIAEKEQARKLADNLLSSEMFNGWGIRTLAANALRYNPLAYHLGTVWPHDNSLIAAGFKRYGLDQAALRVFDGLKEAAMHFEAGRLPELFGGFAREDYGIPVSYPVACQPQAWSAGAMPYLLTTLLGLEPDGFEYRLRIVRPKLPQGVNRVEVHGLEVGKSRIDLLFERDGDQVAVRVPKVTGELEVVVEDENRASSTAL
jgi:glycogen debranching enzyme